MRTDVAFIQSECLIEGMTAFTMSHPARVSRERSAKVKEIAAWCTDQWGEHGPTKAWDYSPVGVFFFEDQNFAFQFRLTWT